MLILPFKTQQDYQIRKCKPASVFLAFLYLLPDLSGTIFAKISRLTRLRENVTIIKRKTDDAKGVKTTDRKRAAYGARRYVWSLIDWVAEGGRNAGGLPVSIARRVVPVTECHF